VQTRKSCVKAYLQCQGKALSLVFALGWGNRKQCVGLTQGMQCTTLKVTQRNLISTVWEAMQAFTRSKTGVGKRVNQGR